MVLSHDTQNRRFHEIAQRMRRFICKCFRGSNTREFYVSVKPLHIIANPLEPNEVIVHLRNAQRKIGHKNVQVA